MKDSLREILWFFAVFLFLFPFFVLVVLAICYLGVVGKNPTNTHNYLQILDRQIVTNKYYETDVDRNAASTNSFVYITEKERYSTNYLIGYLANGKKVGVLNVEQ
jgi:hypothetical protein